MHGPKHVFKGSDQRCLCRSAEELTKLRHLDLKHHPLGPHTVEVTRGRPAVPLSFATTFSDEQLSGNARCSPWRGTTEKVYASTQVTPLNPPLFPTTRVRATRRDGRVEHVATVVDKMNTHGNRALSLTSSSQRLRCTQVSCPLALPSVLHCSSLSSALCSQALSSSSQRGGANGGSSARATSTPCGIEVLTGSSQRWVARSSSLCTHVGSHRGLDPHQHRRPRASTTLGKTRQAALIYARPTAPGST